MVLAVLSQGCSAPVAGNIIFFFFLLEMPGSWDAGVLFLAMTQLPSFTLSVSQGTCLRNLPCETAETCPEIPQIRRSSRGLLLSLSWQQPRCSQAAIDDADVPPTRLTGFNQNVEGPVLGRGGNNHFPLPHLLSSKIPKRRKFI